MLFLSAMALGVTTILFLIIGADVADNNYTKY